jgi:hypothetical protein
MNKITNLFVLCFLFLTIQLFAQDDEIAWDNGDNQDAKVTPDEDVVWVFDIPEKKESTEIVIEKEKGLVRVPDRKLELGVFNFNSGFSNDFMTASQFFREKIEIDIDKFSDGINVNANLVLSPVYISYNKDNNWGLGLSTGLDLIGVIGLNGNMLTFHEADAAKSDIGAAVFSDIKIHGFFIYEKFKIKVKPALYYPILYAKTNNFSYTYTNNNNETIFNLGLDMQVYTAYHLDGDFNITDIFDKITATPGIDISIGAEYPLSETLELTKKYNFLDFDVEIDFINIPLYPSTMEDYMRVIMNIGSDKPIDFFNDMDDFLVYDIEDYGKERRNVFRPFKMLVSANWRPFYRPSPKDTDEWLRRKKEWLVFIPILGFAINPLYSQPASFEGGIKTRLNLANLFIVTLDIGYHDRLWKNSLELGFNFRIFEVDLGMNMQSPHFIKSWSGGGFGAAFGIKFGW